MPYGNGTGPSGMGPMTGRGAGFCAGYTVQGFANRGFGGRGMGFGRGRDFGARGMGFRGSAYMGSQPMNYQSYEQPDNLDYLKEQAGYLKNDLASINERIATLEKGMKNEDSSSK